MVLGGKGGKHKVQSNKTDENYRSLVIQFIDTEHGPCGRGPLRGRSGHRRRVPTGRPRLLDEKERETTRNNRYRCRVDDSTRRSYWAVHRGHTYPDSYGDDRRRTDSFSGFRTRRLPTGKGGPSVCLELSSGGYLDTTNSLSSEEEFLNLRVTGRRVLSLGVTNSLGTRVSPGRRTGRDDNGHETRTGTRHLRVHTNDSTEHRLIVAPLYLWVLFLHYSDSCRHRLGPTRARHRRTARDHTQQKE